MVPGLAAMATKAVIKPTVQTLGSSSLLRSRPRLENSRSLGKGTDIYGNFRFEGAATSPTEIAMTKLYGPANNWWHKATVDLDKREMRGNWGGAWYPNKVDGSLVFQRQMTQEEIEREAEAASRAAEEAKRKQEEEAAAATRKKQEEEAAAAAARQKREEEEAARKKQQDAEEAARKKQEQEIEEAARKQQEEAETAQQRAEEAEAARKKQEEEAERARKEREEAERARQKESENALQKRKDAEQLASRPQSTAQTTNETRGNPGVSTKDSDDDVAGNLKVHLKLDVDADIRVIAALRGDVAIGIL